MRQRTTWSPGVIASLLVLGTAAVFTNAGSKDLMDDFKQILPRGRLAAINQPKFVPAREAKIRDEAWVLGIVVDGQARAYSLNVLNRHEVVNDRIGDRPIAVVW